MDNKELREIDDIFTTTDEDEKLRVHPIVYETIKKLIKQQKTQMIEKWFKFAWDDHNEMVDKDALLEAIRTELKELNQL